MLTVNISITLLSLASFDPIQSNYATKFLLSMEWLDSRLRYFIFPPYHHLY